MAGIDTSGNGYTYREQETGNSNRKTDASGNVINAVYGSKKDQEVKVEDFLNLMVAQLKNQDFMNPVEDTQYVTQLAQFATMQQMQEMAAYSKSNYAMGLVGKDVTAAKYSASGTLITKSGPVERISLVDNEYKIYVDGTPFSLEQIMELNGVSSGSNTPEKDTTTLPITASDITDISVKLTWPAATVNASVANKLTYSVYLSTVEDFDTVEEVEAIGLQLGDLNRKDLTEETAKGLHPNTTYYVNVVVTDGDGVKTTYKKSSFKTLPKGSAGTEEV